MSEDSPTMRRKIKIVIPTCAEGACGRCQEVFPLVRNPRGPVGLCMPCFEQIDLERTHGLKTVAGPFAEVLAGRKKFEYRIDDRDFQVGDLLQLRELYSNGPGYTNRIFVVRITYIIRGDEAEKFGVAKGYAVLSIEDAFMESDLHQFDSEKASMDVMGALFRNGVPTNMQMSMLLGLVVGILTRGGYDEEKIRGFVENTMFGAIRGAHGSDLKEVIESFTGMKGGDA